MAGKAACRAFHVVSMAGNPWQGSLPPCKRSEQLFHLKWGSKSQVCSRKPAWQGARPDSTRRVAWGGWLVCFEGLCDGLGRAILLLALRTPQVPGVLGRDRTDAVVLCARAELFLSAPVWFHCQREQLPRDGVHSCASLLRHLNASPR